MKTYEFEIRNGHYALKIEGRKYIFDTGSPTSLVFKFGRDHLIEGNNVSFPVRYLIPFHNIDDLYNFIGCEVDGILGTDFLRFTGPLRFSKGDMNVTIGENHVRHSTIAKNFEWIEDGHISIDIRKNGMNLKAMFDTGSIFCYVRPEMTDGARSRGTGEDYSPFMGQSFPIEFYEFNENDFDLNILQPIAAMPRFLSDGMDLCNIDMILGLNSIRWETFFIDPGQNIIGFDSI